MSEGIAEPTQEDFWIAFNGLLLQARRFGVDIKNPDNMAFIQHTAEVIAAKS